MSTSHAVLTSPAPHGLALHSLPHPPPHPHPHLHSLALAHTSAHLYGAGIAASSHYPPTVHSRLAFARPLPARDPALAPAAFAHPPPAAAPHGCTAPLTMADPSAYLASDEELAHLQKLSSEYEPEASVSPARAQSCILFPSHNMHPHSRARMYRH